MMSLSFCYNSRRTSASAEMSRRALFPLHHFSKDPFRKWLCDGMSCQKFGSLLGVTNTWHWDFDVERYVDVILQEYVEPIALSIDKIFFLLQENVHMYLKKSWNQLRARKEAKPKLESLRKCCLRYIEKTCCKSTGKCSVNTQKAGRHVDGGVGLYLSRYHPKNRFINAWLFRENMENQMHC